MPLQLGTWRMFANAWEGSLLIRSVSPTGVVAGTLNIGVEGRLTGFWDETSQELTFSLNRADGSPGIVLPLFYKGYLFSSLSNPQPGQDVRWTLAGFFQMVDDFPTWIPSWQANSRRNIFGWYAQIDVVV